MEYETPRIDDLGDVASLTGQLDKIGEAPDAATPFIPALDGSIIPDI